jgi:hypothetical protein
MGGATRWESVAHELPRRRPSERQPDVDRRRADPQSVRGALPRGRQSGSTSRLTIRSWVAMDPRDFPRSAPCPASHLSRARPDKHANYERAAGGCWPPIDAWCHRCLSATGVGRPDRPESGADAHAPHFSASHFRGAHGEHGEHGAVPAPQGSGAGRGSPRPWSWWGRRSPGPDRPRSTDPEAATSSAGETEQSPTSEQSGPHGRSIVICRTSYQAVSRSSAIVLETIGLPIEYPAYMPVTLDLSSSRRAMIQVGIKNGCPEGGSDA